MSASMLLAPLQGLLQYFQQNRFARDDKMDEALLAIKTALIESRKYAEESHGKKAFNRQREYELSQLWGTAAVKCRHASNDLAMRLNDKSLYWSDTLEWSAEEVIARRIDFESIETSFNELLNRHS